MKKIVFFGDGILCHPTGYSEHLVETCILHQPITQFESFHLGEPLLTLDAAHKSIPAVLGKAPDLIYLGLGHADFLNTNLVLGDIATLHALTKVFLLKTNARLVIASICSAFIPHENHLHVQKFNAGIASMVNDRIRFLNLDEPVAQFLEKHRSGNGEKRALHGNDLSLTSMGRVFLANEAFVHLPWNEFLTD